jgi:CHAT domain-containing protein/tetratricopeptide (TPR) repeat protein
MKVRKLMRMNNLIIPAKVLFVLSICFLSVAAQKPAPTPAGADKKLQAAAKIEFDAADKLFDEGTPEAFQAAKAKFQKAAEIFRRAGDKKGEGESVFLLGRVTENLGDARAAMDLYNQALELFRQTGERESEAYALNNIGVLLLGAGELRQAEEKLDSALKIAEELAENEALLSLIVNNLGFVYRSLGEMPKAAKFYQRALDLAYKIEDFPGRAHALNNFGEVQNHLGDRQTALKMYETALEIARKIKDVELQVKILNNTGIAHFSAGEREKALENYQSALKLLPPNGNKNLEGVILNNIGMVFDSRGDKQNAIVFYNRALPLVITGGDKETQASILANLGLTYDSLNDKKRALEYFTQALKIAREAHLKTLESTALLNIGSIYDSISEEDKAIEHFLQVIKTTEETLDVRLAITALNNIGKIFLEAREPQNALLFFNKALPPAKQSGFREIESKLLNNAGYAFEQRGDAAKAQDFYLQALAIARRIGDKAMEGGTLSNLMLLQQKQKNSDFAVFFGKQSVNIYQNLRSNIKNLDKDLQKTYLESVSEIYRQLAEILIASGRIAEAEQVLAMLKEDEYFEFVRRDDKVASELKSRISLSPAELEAFKNYEKLADETTRLGREFSELEAKRNSLPLDQTLSAEEQAQYDLLKKKLDDAAAVFNKFLEDLKIKFGQRDVRVAQIESDTQGILKQLGEPKTVIISTIVGYDKLNLIVTTAGAQRAHTVNITESELNKLIFEFREAVKNPTVDPRVSGKKLYEKLFPAALQKDLENVKADTIIWSLDGTLRYAPIAALWDGKQYLVEKYTNAVLTLASRNKLDAKTSDRKKWQALGVGVSKQAVVQAADGSTKSFDALAAVPEELCSVVNDPQKKDFCAQLAKDKTGVISGVSLFDEQFTLQNFQRYLGRTPIVHIASHFSLNAGNETDSFLLLGGGDERKFTLSNLGSANLNSVELLTLSACNTAMSAGSKSNGLEIESFGALAQNKGAKSVLATLWAVADSSTRDLMIEFYRQIENDAKTGKAEALRKAQIALLNGKYSSEEGKTKRSDLEDLSDSGAKQPPFKKDANAPFAHPYYWSPFILFGNWQ